MTFSAVIPGRAQRAPRNDDGEEALVAKCVRGDKGAPTLDAVDAAEARAVPTAATRVRTLSVHELVARVALGVEQCGEVAVVDAG